MDSKEVRALLASGEAYERLKAMSSEPNENGLRVDYIDKATRYATGESRRCEGETTMMLKGISGYLGAPSRRAREDKLVEYLRGVLV